MREKRYLSEVEIAEILELRAAGNTCREIADAYGVSQPTISKTCARHGVVPADKPACKRLQVIEEAAAEVEEAPAAEAQDADIMPIDPPAEGVKVCPYCHEILPAKARFCYMCGKVPKTEAELLNERLDKLANAFHFVPSNQRDEAIQTINAMREFIKTHAR